MHRARFRIGPLLAIGAIGVLLVIGGCGDPNEVLDDEAGSTGGWSTAGCELTRLPENVTVGTVTMPATPAKLSEAMARIEKGGQGEYADSYAGLEVDQQRVRAIVYRVPSESFDQFIRQNAEDTCIVVRDAVHSMTDLVTWHDRVLADLPFWTNRGIRINTIGARHDGVGVQIGTQDVDRARLELPARYGSRAPLVFVKEGPVHPIAAATAAPPGG
jgi:hypothetical protein